ARLHNILADAYNHQTRRWSPPDANEMMALMKAIAELPEPERCYQEVNLRDEKPTKNGWYFMTGSDSHPREYGRAFFYDGKWKSDSFDWAGIWNNNTHIYWLKLIEKEAI
ncbi:MAG TPA: hypothetical protein VFE62_26250, partial [Gemmataceae bacterium]|nr:hypothetical protein [Gemmataceae bacterium]